MLTLFFDRSFKIFLSIFLSYLSLAIGSLIYWIIIDFHGDLGLSTSFLLLVVISLLISVFQLWLYYVIYYFFKDKWHLDEYIIFIGVILVMIIYYFSINELEYFLNPFFPKRIIPWVLEEENIVIAFLPVIYLFLLSTMYLIGVFLFKKRK